MTRPIMQSLPAGAARRVVDRALHRRRCAFAGLVVLLLGGSSAEGESATRVVTGEVAVAWEFERDGDAEGWGLLEAGEFWGDAVYNEELEADQ